MTQTVRKTIKKQSRLSVLRAANFSGMPWLMHGFSTRVGGFSRAYGKGDLNLGMAKDDSRAAVERNRSKFMSEVTAGAATKPGTTKHEATNPGSTKRGAADAPVRRAWSLVTIRQIHSDLIRCVEEIPEEPLTGDGLITATAGLVLAIQTADCLPVILVDAKRQAIGVFHAGWRGTVQRIVEKGVGEMVRCFGSRPRDLKAGDWPRHRRMLLRSRRRGADEIRIAVRVRGRTVPRSERIGSGARKVSVAFSDCARSGTRRIAPEIFLDLVEANRRQSLDAGVSRRTSRHRRSARIAIPSCCSPIAGEKAKPDA